MLGMPYSNEFARCGSEIGCLMQLKVLRREVADLLKTNRQENARIRVENIIREQLMLQVGGVLSLMKTNPFQAKCTTLFYHKGGAVMCMNLIFVA